MLRVKRKEIEAQQRQRFDNILRFADSIIQKNNPPKSKHPILEVIRMLGRKTQSELLAKLLEYEESPQQNLDPGELFFTQSDPITNDGRNFIDFKKNVPIQKTIHLKKDLVLPYPTKHNSLLNSFNNIGVDRIWGPWTQVNIYHVVELWLPLGIVWVHRGSHSIAAGIIKGEGIIQTYNVFDISAIYDHVHCDGVNYYRTEDQSIITPVENVEFAAIFEIGRLLKANSISF